MAVTLNSNTLANYAEEEVESFLRGASYSLASGAIQHDNVSTTRKRRWRIQWRALTSAQKETIATQYIVLVAGTGSGSFTDIHGDTYTITVPQNRKTISIRTVNASPLRFDVSVEFEEV